MPTMKTYWKPEGIVRRCESANRAFAASPQYLDGSPCLSKAFDRAFARLCEIKLSDFHNAGLRPSELLDYRVFDLYMDA